MQMATSLQSKIDDLEARFKAESFEDSSRSRPSEPQLGAKPFINNAGLNANSPFRKMNTEDIKDFSLNQNCNPKNIGSLSSSENVFSLQKPLHRPRSGTPQRVLHTNNFTKPFSLNKPDLHLKGFSKSDNKPSDQIGECQQNSNVSFTHTSKKAFARPGSAGNLSLGGQTRKRQVFNMHNISTKSQDSIEIEQKYIEIMKSAGYLNINGEKIATDIQEMGVLGELGHGTCGHVMKMLHIPTNTIMAVKQMRRSGNSEENKRIIMDLDVVMKCHSCPYIVKSLGTFITPTDVWICMELMATCLDKLMKRLGECIPEKVLGKVTVATLNALHYLKETHGVIHRDVKPSNILLDERGNIKLCDFGISGRLVDSKAKTRSAGCAAYMAPERIDPPDPTKPDYDIRADVWSLGLTLVELALGEFPYKNCQSDFEVLTKVLQDDQPRLPACKGFSMDFVNFVDLCLIKDYNRRPKYQKLLEHNFVRRYTGLYVDVSSWYAEVSKGMHAETNNLSNNINTFNNANNTSRINSNKNNIDQVNNNTNEEQDVTFLNNRDFIKSPPLFKSPNVVGNNPFFSVKSKKLQNNFTTCQQTSPNPLPLFSYPAVKRFDPLCTDPPTPLSPTQPSSSPHAWSSFSSSSLKSSTFSPSPSSSHPFNSSLSSSSSNTASPFKSPSTQHSSQPSSYTSNLHITPFYNTSSYASQQSSTFNNNFTDATYYNSPIRNLPPKSAPPIKSSLWSPDNQSSASSFSYVSPSSPAHIQHSSISLSAISSALQTSSSPFIQAKPTKTSSVTMTLSNPFINNNKNSYTVSTTSPSFSSSQPLFTTSYKTRLQNLPNTARHYL